MHVVHAYVPTYARTHARRALSKDLIEAKEERQMEESESRLATGHEFFVTRATTGQAILIKNSSLTIMVASPIVLYVLLGVSSAMHNRYVTNYSCSILYCQLLKKKKSRYDPMMLRKKRETLLMSDLSIHTCV